MDLHPLAHPHTGIPNDVMQLFMKLTLKLIDNDWEHYSARAILHQIRWHYKVEKGQRDFKCDNNWTPTMARVFHKAYPEHDGFFRCRKSPGTVPGVVA